MHFIQLTYDVVCDIMMQFYILLTFFYFLSFSGSLHNHHHHHNGVTRYSSEEISGNESNETHIMSELERQADFNRHKEEMKRKRRRKKRTSSSMQSSTFQGKNKTFHCVSFFSPLFLYIKIFHLF